MLGCVFKTVYLQRQGGIYINKFFQKNMLDFTFDSLFRTSNKGIPTSNDLSQPFILPTKYFISSVVVQSVFFLLYLFYFAISVYRVVKMTKNNKFGGSKIEKALKQGLSQKDERQRQNSSNYQFDQDDQAQEEANTDKNEAVYQKSQPKAHQMSFEDYHDENQGKFLKLDCKLLNFQCLLISFVVCNNSLNAEIFSPFLITLSITSFILFDIKKLCAKTKILKSFCIIFAGLGFSSFFYKISPLPF